MVRKIDWKNKNVITSIKDGCVPQYELNGVVYEADGYPVDYDRANDPEGVITGVKKQVEDLGPEPEIEKPEPRQGNVYDSPAPRRGRPPKNVAD